MFVSEHTVQDHLKSVFAKTATNNHRMLLVRHSEREPWVATPPP